MCNNHDTPVPMYVYEGAMTPFYACPRYMKKDKDHPNGHEEFEKGCANRVSFEDVRHIVEKLGKQMSEDEASGVIADYTGMRFKWKSVDVVVLKYTNNKITLGVSNKKEIGTWRN